MFNQQPRAIAGAAEAARGRASAAAVAGQREQSGALHIPSLDGIRALSFGLVFAGHAGLNRVVPTVFGVTVFFFLSGYLITTLLRREAEKSGTISFEKFYLRRVLRIFPPFYLVLALALGAAFVGLVPPAAEPASITSVILHYSNYYIVAHDHQGFLAGTGVYWSLAVEEHFYLLFPCLYWLLTKTTVDRRKQALAVLGLCAVILVWRCMLHYLLGASMHRTQVASDTRFDSLLFGCALALYENPALDRTAFSERTWKCVLLPLGLGGLLLSFALRQESFRETLRYSLQGLSLVPVFVCAVRYPSWSVMRMLNLKPLAFVGGLSYSLYLIHLLMLGIVGIHFQGKLGALPIGLLSLLGSLAVSWIIYRTVEQPCANLRRKLN
jgi:peptidoglycan/LPS O-acetylase OafA/YrhL